MNTSASRAPTIGLVFVEDAIRPRKREHRVEGDVFQGLFFWSRTQSVLASVNTPRHSGVVPALEAKASRTQSVLASVNTELRTPETRKRLHVEDAIRPRKREHPRTHRAATIIWHVEDAIRPRKREHVADAWSPILLSIVEDAIRPRRRKYAIQEWNRLLKVFVEDAIRPRRRKYSRPTSSRRSLLRSRTQSVLAGVNTHVKLGPMEIDAVSRTQSVLAGVNTGCQRSIAKPVTSHRSCERSHHNALTRAA